MPFVIQASDVVYAAINTSSNVSAMARKHAALPTFSVAAQPAC